MVFLKVVSVGLASPRGLTVQCFPQEYFSPTPPFHFRCVGPYVCRRLARSDAWRESRMGREGGVEDWLVNSLSVSRS